MTPVPPQRDNQEASVDPKCLAELGRLEVLLHSGKKIAFSEMSAFFELFIKNFEFVCFKENKQLEPHLVQLYTRVSMLLTSWLAYEEYDLDFDALYALSLRQSSFYNLFSASGFRGCGHLINYVASFNEDGTINIDGARLVYLLALMPLDEINEPLFDAAMKLDERSKTLVILGWLQTRNVFTAEGERFRSKVFDNADILSRVTPNYQMLISFLNSWMHCSYAASEHKHDYKYLLNKMIRNYLIAEGVEITSKAYQLKNKPKMLVIHERFTSSHAMYRCYAPLIKMLRPYFEIVSMGEKGQVGDAFPELFDQHIVLDEINNTKDLVSKIKDLSPDIIYYPSLGMSHWTICLGNLRLAPVQIATIGHPATTCSDVIDYMFCFDMPEELYQTQSERLLLIKKQGLYTVAHPHLSQITFTNEKWDSNFFHIAINASIMKINGELIRMCQDIEASASRPVKFHFFPAISGIEYDGVINRIAKLLTCFEVYLPASYPELMTNLQKCDISLSPFPFGNSNSLCDALVANLPVVALKGKEIAGQTDEIALEQFGLGKYFICDTLEDYKARVIRLMNDQDFYASLVEKIQEANVYQTILSTLDASSLIQTSDYAEKFGWLVRFAYDYHKQIQSSKAKAIVYEEVCSAKLYSEPVLVASD